MTSRKATMIPCWVLACVLSLSPNVFGATKAIRAGKLIDRSGTVITNAVIVVDNDRITSVGSGAPPGGAEVIDLTRYTIIAGMIDVHTHIGDVTLSIPEKAEFQLDGSTSQGDVDNEFGPALQTQSFGRAGSIKGRAGNGPAITVVTDRGTVSVRKS